MSEAAYTSGYPSTQAASSSFPLAPLPQPSPFSSLSVPDSSNPSDPPPSSEVQPSSAPAYPAMPPPIDYPPILASSPTLSSSSSPSLQQTVFTYPTPPPSNSSSPQPLLSSSSPPGTYHTIPPTNPEMLSPHTPTQTTFSPPCQDPMSLLGQPITNGNNSPADQSSAVFTYPNLLSGNPDQDPVTAQPLPNQNQPPAASNSTAPSLPCSLPAQGASTSFFPPVQNLSFPTVSPTHAHPALHLQNLNQAQAPPLSSAFPPSSFTHPSFQTSSCLGVPAAPSLPPPTHSQNLTPASSSYPSMPPVDIGAISQFNPPAPYLSEMVLHHPPLLPQRDPSLPSCLPSSTAPPTLYPAFPSYPLRLCQDPRSSLSIPLRHLYRQHQHGHAHAQGSYLDMSTRAVY